MKVLHVIPDLEKNHGGPPRAIVPMVKALIERGHDVEILTTRCSSSGLELVQHDDILDRVHFISRSSIVKFIGYAPEINKWLEKNVSNYDVIHIHSIFNYTTHQAMTWARLKNVPYVLRPAGILSPWVLKQKALIKSLWLMAIEKKKHIKTFCYTCNIGR